MTPTAEALLGLISVVAGGGTITAIAALVKERREGTASAPEILKSWMSTNDELTDKVGEYQRQIVVLHEEVSVALVELGRVRREVDQLRREVEVERGLWHEARALLVGPVTTIIRWIEAGGLPPAPGEADGLADRISALVERARR